MIVRLSVAEVAKAIGRHPQTVRRALEAGDLHGTQPAVNGHWRIREDCAEAWADGRPCEHQGAVVTPLRGRRSA